MRTCPNCGHENQDNDRFCSNCGARLTTQRPPDETQSESPSSPVEESPEQESTPAASEESSSPPPSSIPRQFTPPAADARNPWDLADREPVGEDWTMSSLGPPPKRPRRTWLWIIVGILALFVLACCIFFFWVSATDSGSQWFNDFATEVSNKATEQAQ